MRFEGASSVFGASGNESGAACVAEGRLPAGFPAVTGSRRLVERNWRPSEPPVVVPTGEARALVEVELERARLDFRLARVFEEIGHSHGR